MYVHYLFKKFIFRTSRSSICSIEQVLLQIKLNVSTRLVHCPTIYNPATLPLWQMLQQVMGKNFVPVKPPEMDRLSYPPLARELYEEHIRKPNAIKVSVCCTCIYTNPI